MDTSIEILEGPPAESILRVADIRRCDLIVMGNRGQGEVKSLLQEDVPLARRVYGVQRSLTGGPMVRM